MDKLKVLFINQAIVPYVDESQMAIIGRQLPQGIQERKKEIRTFMPRFGCINERRNSLHEVIRLSGMNLIIDDTDHPLIIKVASIQQARMQIYFIDNEDFFQRKFILTDKNGEYFPDNDERAVFYTRGVLETVKKLGWSPDIVHCHGWFSSIAAIFVKKAYSINPLFTESKVVLSVYDDDFPGELNSDFYRRVKMDGIKEKDLKLYREPSYVNIIKNAINFSDGIIYGAEKINSELETYIKSIRKPVLSYQPIDNYIDAYSQFYDKINKLK